MKTAVTRTGRGFTLVELMAGLAVGSLVLAGALGLMLVMLRDARHLQLESQMAEAMRLATEVMVRDLRRADDVDIQDAGSQASYQVAPENDDTSPGHHGFRLKNGAIEMQIGQGAWHALTDPALLTVTGLRFGRPHPGALDLRVEARLTSFRDPPRRLHTLVALRNGMPP